MLKNSLIFKGFARFANSSATRNKRTVEKYGNFHFKKYVFLSGLSFSCDYNSLNRIITKICALNKNESNKLNSDEDFKKTSLFKILNEKRERLKKRSEQLAVQETPGVLVEASFDQKLEEESERARLKEKLSRKSNKKENNLEHNSFNTMPTSTSSNQQSSEKPRFIERGSPHWDPGTSPQINEVLKAFPQIELLWDDVRFNVRSRKGHIVYRCKDHPAVVNWTNSTHYYHTSKDPKEDKGDGQPAYCTEVRNFLKNERKACCAYYLDILKKQGGYLIALNLLKERGQRYGTTYTIVDTPEEWKGKRIQRKGEEHYARLKCTEHEYVTSYPYERLKLNASTFCPYCRDAYRNIPVSPPEVREHNRKHKGPWYKFYRRDSMALWGGQCAITNLILKEEFADLIEIHHLNSKEIYPDLKTNSSYNSIALLKPIHYAFHYAYLGNFDLSYDDKATSTSLRSEANILTFLFFLKQLIRDFKTENNNSLLNLVQNSITSFYEEAMQKGMVLSGDPTIKLSNLEKLYSKLDNVEYLSLWESDKNNKNFKLKLKTEQNNK